MKLKTTLCSTPDLRPLDMNHPFEIEKNTSQFSIGDVLKKGGHLIMYHSKTLIEDKVKYNKYDKEFYSLVHALKQWRHYILVKETILHIDNHQLIFINSQSKMREQRHLK